MKSIFSGLLAISLAVLSLSAKAETYYFHTDHLGTPQVLTDSNQAVAWKGDYKPFGEVSEQVNVVTQNLRFPGQYFDNETVLHYNYYRDYDFLLGRYSVSDPIGLYGGLNTYAYVRGNPISNADPLGLADFFFGFEIDLTGIMGIEVSFGIVIDTDSELELESGFFFSSGYSVGANVGAGVAFGYAECDIEGTSYGVDANIGLLSYFGGQGLDGGFYGGVSLGRGLGASANISETVSYTFKDHIDWLLGK